LADVMSRGKVFPSVLHTIISIARRPICKNIPHDSRAWQDIVNARQLRSQAIEVDGDLWIDHPRAFDVTVLEQAIRVGENILVMVAVTNDHVISEIIEADETG